MLQTSTWRVIRTSAASGAWNMALDEAILEAVGSGEAPSTLRLYAWQPPCLSLGYAQPIADVDRQALHQFGWQIVRRPTGGRAILHTDELTYSVIAPHHEPRVAGDILESYRRLSQGLLLALRELGLPAKAEKEYSLPAGIQPKGAVCFEVPSNYEITIDGKKLIGSAQARRREGVLQHGSLPLYGDLSRITSVLVFASLQDRQNAARRLLERATTVEKTLQRIVTWDEAASAFEAGFEQALDLRLEAAQPARAELERAAQLVSEKYDNPAWSERH